MENNKKEIVYLLSYKYIFRIGGDKHYMGRTKRLGINLVTQTVSFILNTGINFLLTPFIVKYINEQIYGFVGLANTFTGYITIVTVALNSLHSRYVMINMAQEKYETASEYFSSVTIANIVTSVILLIPSSILIVFLNRFLQLPPGFEFDIKVLWAFMFLSFLLSIACGTLDVAPYCCDRLDLSAKRTMESNILKSVVLVAMFSLFSPNIWFVGFAGFIAAIYVVLTNVRYVRKLTPQLKLRVKLFSWEKVKQLIGDGVWSSINQLTQVLMNGIDLLIANIAISAMDMSLLSYSKVIPLQLTNLLMTISNIFSPGITIKYATASKEEFIKEINKAMKICGFFCSVPIIGLAVFGRPFYTLWLPTLSAQQIKSVEILSILTILPVIFHAYIYPLFITNVVTCKIKVPGIFSLIIGVLNIIGVIILLNVTTWGIFAIKIVSTVLLVVKIVLFIPIYAARTISSKWYTFYIPLIRATISTISIIIVFNIILRVIPLDSCSWIKFIVVVTASGIIGYIMNFIILLNNKEKLFIKDLIRTKIINKAFKK